MTKYSIIYKIHSPQTSKVYYGFTTQTCAQRLSLYRQRYKSYLSGNYKYESVFDVISLPDHKIEIIEHYNAKDIDDLNKRLGEIVQTDENALTKCKHTRKHKEETEKIDNNEKFTCETCGGRYTYKNKHQHLKSNKHKNGLASKEDSQSVTSQSDDTNEDDVILNVITVL